MVFLRSSKGLSCLDRVIRWLMWWLLFFGWIPTWITVQRREGVEKRDIRDVFACTHHISPTIAEK